MFGDNRWNQKSAMMASVDPEITRHYGHYYESGATKWRNLSAIGKANNITNLCVTTRHQTVLEIGAGDGAVLEQLSKANFAEIIDAIEISETAITTIKSRGIDGLREVSLFNGSDIPREDGSYDLAILSHVVEHLEHPRQLLREAARVAKKVLVEVPLELKVRTPNHFKWNDTGHINLYSPKIIRHLLQSTGLEILNERTVNHSYDVYRYLSGKRGVLHWAVKQLSLVLAPRLATFLFTYNWVALCGSSRSGIYKRPK